jgi:hypothetical protein
MIFQNILNHTVKLAYELLPQKAEYLWRGMSVYAIDGSSYNLPATDEIRKEFDPESGLDYPGKGHYPKCLVSTAYDVFRRLPIARSIVKDNGSERDEARSFIPLIPSGGVILFDRGYPGYEFIKDLIKSYSGCFIFRSPGSSTFPAVISFLASNKDEDIIWLNPTRSYRVHLGVKMWRQAKPIKLRVIKLVSPDGTVSVLLTNLMNSDAFSLDDITNLYFRRREVETHYRNEKTVLDIEKFHGKSPNSIRQELFAIMIVSVISRILMECAEQSHQHEKGFPQFKHAIMTIAYDAAALTPDDPVLAVNIFKELLDEIARVRYYHSQKKRSTQPRVTKRKINRWSLTRQKKLAKP